METSRRSFKNAVCWPSYYYVVELTRWEVSESELNEVIRDLSLLKVKARKQKPASTWDLIFMIEAAKKGNRVYCNDVYRNLLHNGNIFATPPTEHSVHMKENYNDLDTIFMFVEISRLTILLDQ